MKFGLVLPVSGPFASREAIVAVARTAEELGYEAVCIHDHLNWDARDKYHFMAGTAEAVEEAEARGARVDNFYEHVTTFAYLAGVTRRVKLLSAATVLPWRHPVLLAKQAAMVQEFSGGRLVLGVCIGNVRGDFEMSGVPFEQRGARTEDYLRVLACCLSPEPEVTFRGRYVAFERGVFFPKPDPPVPLLYAGESEAALRRAARLCDGWLPLGSPGFIAGRLPRLRGYLEASGRAAAIPDFTVGFLTRICLGATDDEARQKVGHTIERQLGIEEIRRHPQLAEAYVVGSSATVAARLHEYEQAGANLCVMALISPSLDHMLADMAAFATEVVPQCAA